MRATKAEILQRVEAILEIRLAGAEFVDIRKYAVENGWQVSDTQLRRYIHKTDEILAQNLERDREKLFNRHMAQRFALYARAMSVSDYRTALAVLKDQAELQGLYPTRTQKISQDIKVTGVVTPEERRQFWTNLGHILRDAPDKKEQVAALLRRQLAAPPTNGKPQDAE